MFLNRPFCCLLFFSSSIAFAQEFANLDTIKTTALDEIVITATRTEKQLASIPLPTSIISSIEISKAGITKLNEILTEQTGLITIPDFGGGEGIQVQGLDAAYTLILIDGVPLVGRSAGTLDLSRISVGNIDRIEIVKGASSSLYGSEALAGVINIITKRPKKDSVSGNASFRYATFNTQDANANLVWKKKKLSGSLFANYFSTDGYDLDKSTKLKTIEPYHNTTFQPKLYYAFSSKLNIALGSRFYHQKQEYKATVENEDYQGKSSIDEWNGQVKAEHKWSGKIYSEYEIYLTNYKAKEYLNHSSNNELLEESYYSQWLFRPEIRTTFSIKDNKLTTGIGVNQETLNRTYFENKATFNSQYFYTQYDYNPTKKWNLLAGFRYDNHNQYQSQFSPKIATNYKISNSLIIKSSIGYGFKAPDFRQLYFDFTNPTIGYTVLGYNVIEDKLKELETQGQLLYKTEDINYSNSLKPESSINFNLGSTYQKNKIKIDINTFYNSISNLIDTRVVAQKTNGQNVFSYFNITEIFTYGLELNSTYKFNNEFKIAVGYQYLIAKDKDVVTNIANSEVYARDPETLQSFQIKKTDYFGLFNRSKHTANVKIYYTIPNCKTAISLRVFYRSKYGLFDTNNNQILDKYDEFVNGYCLTNLSVTKKIASKYDFQIGANNLFNFTNAKEISNISGRQIFGKIQFNF